MPNYRRATSKGGTYFFTVVTPATVLNLATGTAAIFGIECMLDYRDSKQNTHEHGLHELLKT